MGLSSKQTENCLQAADSLLALIIFFPSMVCYWRGIWDLVGEAIRLERPLQDWVTFGIGSCTVFGYFLHPWVGNVLGSSKKWVYVVMSRVYLFFFAAVYMTYWRGVWSLGDWYMSSVGLGGDLIGLFVSYFPMLLLRTSRTVVFPPCIVILDTRKDLFDTTTCFQVKTERRLLYILDSCFTHFVVMTLTIMTWRCAWSIWQRWAEVIWPGEQTVADFWSLIIGSICIGFLFLIQEFFANISRYLEKKNIGYSKLIYENVVYLVVLFSLLWIWRGGWNLNATFMIQDTLVGGAVNFVVGTILLMGLQLFSYVSCCGCGLDGYDANGAAFFPLKYLRVYLLPKLTKKQETYQLDGRNPEPHTDGEPAAAVTVYTVSDGNQPVYRGQQGDGPMSPYGVNGDSFVYCNKEENGNIY